MGRFGPERMQDWYRGLAKAVKIERKLLSAHHMPWIVVVDAIHVKGHVADSEMIVPALRKLGAKGIYIGLESHETIGELEAAYKIVQRTGAEFIVISTFAHYLRVAWLLRGIKAKHYIAFGLPRWFEMVTDVILTLLFPVIDLCGGREWFRKKVDVRRKSGRQ